MDARGRGRPAVGQRVSVRLPPALLQTVDRHAAAADMSRAAYLRALIAAAIPPDDVDRTQIRRLLALTPAERVRRHGQTVDALSRLRSAARR